MRRRWFSWNGLRGVLDKAEEIEDREVRSIRKMLCHPPGELVAAQLHPASGPGPCFPTTLKLITVSFVRGFFATSFC
ncbi:hypothetical protein BDW72DRAFT_141804 [Aspergillus terricola var. indicus]